MSRVDARPEDVQSVDGIIRALYESVSFEAGREPDWGRMQSLFVDGAILVPPAPGPGEPVEVLSLDQFASATRARLAQGAAPSGFFEREIDRRVTGVGNVLHVASGYESRFGEGEGSRAVRGTNSIQMVRFAGRYFVVSVVWDLAREG